VVATCEFIIVFSKNKQTSRRKIRNFKGQRTKKREQLKNCENGRLLILSDILVDLILSWLYRLNWSTSIFAGIGDLPYFTALILD